MSLLESPVHIIRESISVITQILSSKKVPVYQRGMTACVNYDPVTGEVSSVVLPYLPDNASDKLIFAVQGFLDHEVGHILFTDSEALVRIANDTKLVQMQNVFEDPFVEKGMRSRFNGTAHNLGKLFGFFIDAVLEKNYQKLIDNGETHPLFYFSVLAPAITRAWHGVYEFEEYMKKDDKWSRVKPVLDILPSDIAERALNAASTTDNINIARDVLMALEKGKASLLAPPKSAADPDEEEEEGDGGSPGDGEMSESDGKSGEAIVDEEGDPEDDAEPSEDEKTEPDDEESPAAADEDEDEEDKTSGTHGGDVDDADGDESESEDDEEEPEAEKSDGEGEVDFDEPKEEEEDDGKSTSGEDDSAESEDDEESVSDGAEEDDDGDDDAGDADSESESAEEVGELPEIEMRDLESEMSDEIAKLAIADSKASDYTVYTTDHDEVSTVDHSKSDRSAKSINEAVEKMVKKVEDMAGAIQDDLQRSFIAENRSYWQNAQHSGRINPSSVARLFSGDVRVFRKKIERRTQDYDVSIVIDCSGSMSNHSDGMTRIEAAMLSAYAIGSALEAIGINFEIIGFTSKSAPIREDVRGIAEKAGIRYSRTGALFMPVFKSFEENWTSDVWRRLAMYIIDDGPLRENADGECVMIAAKRLAVQPASGKAMLVLSDGQPSCHGAHGHDSAAQSNHLKRVVREIMDAGIKVFGVGIQSACVKEYYPNHAVLTNIKKLPTEVIGRISDMLLS